MIKILLIKMKQNLLILKKKITKKTSPEQNNKYANWEKSEDNNIIPILLKSYSKYLFKKKKQINKATINIDWNLQDKLSNTNINVMLFIKPDTELIDPNI